MLGKALGKPLNKMLMDTGKEGIKGSGNGMTKGTKGAICYGKDSHHFFCFPRYGSSQMMAYTMFLISKETELPQKWNKLQKNHRCNMLVKVISIQKVDSLDLLKVFH